MSLFYLYGIIVDTILYFPDILLPIIMNDYFWAVIVKKSNLKKSIFGYGIIQNMQNLLGRMTKIGSFKTADLRMILCPFLFPLCYMITYISLHL